LPLFDCLYIPHALTYVNFISLHLPALDKKKAPEDSPDVKLGDADKRKRSPSDDENDTTKKEESKPPAKKASGGSYTTSEAKSAYNHLSSYHKKEGWDKSGWWSRKG